jgi:tetratricopeptide (TPR) repeat protein
MNRIFTLFALITVVCVTIHGAGAQEKTPDVTIPFEFIQHLQELVDAKKPDEVVKSILKEFERRQRYEDRYYLFIVAIRVRDVYPAVDLEPIYAQYETELKSLGGVDDKIKKKFAALRVDLLNAMRKHAEAAEAIETLVENQPDSPQRLALRAQAPLALFRAGKKEAALDSTRRLWIERPNDFNLNSAVRGDVAMALDDNGDSLGGFRLLHELRESFPGEFATQPYIVQNYMEFASKTRDFETLGDVETVLTDVLEFGKSCAEQPGMDMVRGDLYFAIGKMLERTGRRDEALQYYKLTTEHLKGAPDYVKVVKSMAEKGVQRLSASPDPLGVPTTARTTPAALPEKNSYTLILLVLNGVFVVVVSLILFVRRNRGTPASKGT